MRVYSYSQIDIENEDIIYSAPYTCNEFMNIYMYIYSQELSLNSRLLLLKLVYCGRVYCIHCCWISLHRSICFAYGNNNQTAAKPIQNIGTHAHINPHIHTHEMVRLWFSTKYENSLKILFSSLTQHVCEVLGWCQVSFGRLLKAEIKKCELIEWCVYGVKSKKTYRIAFTSGEFSWNPLWVIWLVEIKLFWFGSFDGAGLKSFNIVATDT